MTPEFFVTECCVCGREFRTTLEDADMCAICEMNEQVQLEMDRDRG